MLVVADDLSGAVEAAAVLGLRRIALRPGGDGVIDLNTRLLSPERAAARIRALCERPRFKKIDSQLRGNVRAELEALGGELVVAPALPVEGRIVRGGVLYVDGRPRESPVPLLDAETDADLDAIVAAAAPGATLVGSAGLAAALGRTLGAAPLPPPRPADRPLLVVVGTRAAGEQLRRLAATGVPVIDPRAALPGPVAARRGRATPVAAAVAAAPPTDLVLTGGATARHVLDALGITELTTVAQVHHGAVLCEGGGRRMLIRPGGFGGPDSLVE